MKGRYVTVATLIGFGALACYLVSSDSRRDTVLEVTRTGSATPHGYDYEVVHYNVVTSEYPEGATYVGVGLQGRESDYNDKFLVIGEPHFIDYTLTVIDENTVGYWIHEGRDRNIAFQVDEIVIDGRNRPISVKFLGTQSASKRASQAQRE